MRVIKGFALLEALLSLAVVGSLAVAAVPSYGFILKTTVSKAVYNELDNVRSTVELCYKNTLLLSSCDTKAKLGIVADGTIQPYATLTITTTTAVVTETFNNTGRANACSSASGVSGTVVDTPTASNYSTVTWSRAYSGLNSTCQRTN